MRTPRGTPYSELRRLALSGGDVRRVDCEDAEHFARVEHAMMHLELAMTQLLCARALWSAWRAQQRRDG